MLMYFFKYLMNTIIRYYSTRWWLYHFDSSSFFIICISYWSIVDLQCCVSFRCTAKWFSYTYTYIHSFSNSFPISFLRAWKHAKILVALWSKKIHYPCVSAQMLRSWAGWTMREVVFQGGCPRGHSVISQDLRHRETLGTLFPNPGRWYSATFALLPGEGSSEHPGSRSCMEGAGREQSRAPCG